MHDQRFTVLLADGQMVEIPREEILRWLSVGSALPSDLIRLADDKWVTLGEWLALNGLEVPSPILPEVVESVIVAPPLEVMRSGGREVVTQRTIPAPQPRWLLPAIGMSVALVAVGAVYLDWRSEHRRTAERQLELQRQAAAVREEFQRGLAQQQTEANRLMSEQVHEQRMQNIRLRSLQTDARLEAMRQRWAIEDAAIRQAEANRIARQSLMQREVEIEDQARLNMVLREAALRRAWAAEDQATAAEAGLRSIADELDHLRRQQEEEAFTRRFIDRRPFGY